MFLYKYHKNSFENIRTASQNRDFSYPNHMWSGFRFSRKIRRIPIRSGRLDSLPLLGSLRYGNYRLRLQLNMQLRMIKTTWLFIFPRSPAATVSCWAVSRSHDYEEHFAHTLPSRSFKNLVFSLKCFQFTCFKRKGSEIRKLCVISAQIYA